MTNYYYNPDTVAGVSATMAGLSFAALELIYGFRLSRIGLESYVIYVRLANSVVLLLISFGSFLICTLFAIIQPDGQDDLYHDLYQGFMLTTFFLGWWAVFVGVLALAGLWSRL